MNTNSTPLYKNEAARYWEAIYEGRHIVVPFADFDAAVHIEAMKRLGTQTEVAWPTYKGEHDAAWFEVIDASRWNSEQWRHTETEEQRQDHCMSTQKKVCNCPPGFCLYNAIKAQQEEAQPRFDADKLHTSQAEADMEDGAKGEAFTVYLGSDSDEAALERMAAYFYHLYHKAGEGTVQEARYGSLYGQIMSALARRETAQHLETITAQIDTLMATILTTIGVVAEQFSGTEKEEDSDAGAHPTETTSQL